MPRDIVSITNGFDLFNRKLRITVLTDYKGGYILFNQSRQFYCDRTRDVVLGRTSRSTPLCGSGARRSPTSSAKNPTTVARLPRERPVLEAARSVGGADAAERRSPTRSARATRSSSSPRATCTRGRRTPASIRKRTTATGDVQTDFSTTAPRTYFIAARESPLLNRLRGRFYDDETYQIVRSVERPLRRGGRRALLLGACDSSRSCWRRSNPASSARQPSPTPTAADALYVGALGRWKSAMNGGGRQHRSAVELARRCSPTKCSRATRSRSATTPISATLQTNDGVLHADLQRGAAGARPRARRDQRAPARSTPTPTGKQHVGEMYLMMGYLEMALDEAFCNGVPFGETVNGVPQYTQPLTERRRLQARRSRASTRRSRILTGDGCGDASP